MKKCMKLIAGILSITLLLNLYPPVFADIPEITDLPVAETVAEVPGVTEEALETTSVLPPDVSTTDKAIEVKPTEAATETAPLEPTASQTPTPPTATPPFPSDIFLDEDDSPVNVEAPVDQSVLDAINNNPIQSMTVSDSSSQAGLSSEYTLLEEKLSIEISQVEKYETGLAEKSFVSTASTSTLPSAFEADIVNVPFNAYLNSSESVSLATGGMNYQKTLFSLPGKDGLDLNIGIRYSSDNAVVTQDEYLYNNTKNYSGHNFAVGWEFDFPNINTGYNPYGYNKTENITFSDGSSYRLCIERESVSLVDYPFTDLTIAYDSTNDEYILTYPDGTKEYFDAVSGNIIKREDNFNSVIYFEYETLNLYRGSFFSYLSNPGGYLENVTVLSEIKDSGNKSIDFDYDIRQDLNGMSVSRITIDYSEANYKIYLNLDRIDTYKGKVDVLSSIQDAEGHITYFEYEENISNIYDRYQSPAVRGSAVCLTKITYPTGGSSEYDYILDRRSYYWSNDYPEIEQLCGYDVYKVSKHSDSGGEETFYLYEGDRSGYPSGYPQHNTGDITYLDEHRALTEYTYKTIVRHYDATTIHTFDYQHKKISEETYVNSQSATTYLGGRGEARWIVQVGNYLYRVGYTAGIIYITKQKTDRDEVFFMRPTVGDEIKNVKTSGSKIFVFDEEDILIYDTIDDSWQTGEACNMSVDFSTMFYMNDHFYVPHLDRDENTLTHAIYNPASPTQNSWCYNTVSPSFQIPSSLTFIGFDDANIYYVNQGYIYQYNIAGQTLSSNTYGSSGNTVSFFIGDTTYLYSVSGTVATLREYDYATDTFGTSYELPCPATTYDVLQKGADGNLYLFSGHKGEDSFLRIYRFEPLSGTWSTVAYRTMDNERFTVIMGNDVAFITVGFDSGRNEEFGFKTNLYHSYGFEKVNLSSTASTQNRSKLVYTYNDKKQLTKTTQYAIMDHFVKEHASTQISYVADRHEIAAYTDALGNVTSYEYDTRFYIPTNITTVHLDNTKQITTNTLTPAGKSIATTTVYYLNADATEEPERSITTTYTYSMPDTLKKLAGKTVTETKNGTTTTLSAVGYTYNNNGWPKSETQTINGANLYQNSTFTEGTQTLTKRYDYDSMGRTIKERVSESAESADADTQTTQYQYNKLGWLTETTYPDNTSVSYTYILSSSGNNKVITTYHNDFAVVEYYDDMGRIIKQAEHYDNADHIQSTYEYSYPEDNDGNPVIKVIDGFGNYTKYMYDAFGRVISVNRYSANDKLLSTRRAVYNEYELSVGVEFGDTYGQKVFYDILGRKIHEQKNGYQTSYAYDAKNNMTSYTDFAGNVYTYAYDSENRLITATDPLNQSTTYEYDKNNNVSCVTYPGGNAMSYTYDSAGRLTRATDSLNNYEQYAYDIFGNQIAKTDKNGSLLLSTYDKMNRVLQSGAGPNSSIYTYDSLGNVLTASNPWETYTYTYTDNNLLATIETRDGKESNYTYDDLGRLIHVSDYDDNATVYTYDGAGRMASVKYNGTTLVNYSYNTADLYGTVSGFNYRTSYIYDNAMRIARKTHNFNGSDYIEEFTYDALGNQLSKTEKVDHATISTTNYTYDALSRLTGYTGNGTGTYTYDAAGNMTGMSITSSTGDRTVPLTINNTQERITIQNHTVNYTYGFGNRLLSAEESLTDINNISYELDKSYTYDANGNTTSITTTLDGTATTETYSYDQQNRLTGYNSGTGISIGYEYDANHMRIVKSQTGNYRRYYWDRGFIVNEGTGSYGNITINASNVIGSDGIMARDENNVTALMLKNAHGDVSKIITTADDTIRDYAYDPFGNELGYDATDPNPFRYAGEYYDAETNNIYLRNRYYDPATSRMLSEDPAKVGTNWYIYCFNNPVNYIDPTGLSGIRNDGSYYITHPLDEQLLRLKQEYGGASTKRRQEISIEARNIRANGKPGVDYSVTADKPLSYYMIDTDITNKLNNLMKSVGDENFWKRFGSITPVTNATRYGNFALMVMPGGKYDLKSKTEWQQKAHYIYEGDILWYDDPGNILYGYLGKAMGFEDIILQSAAGAVQIATKTSSWSYISSFFDDPRDQASIKRGIQKYKDTNSWIWW